MSSMQVTNIRDTYFGSVKTRAQHEAQDLIESGEYMTVAMIADKESISRATARLRVGLPDKQCGKGNGKIFLYRRDRVEQVMSKYRKKVNADQD